MKIANIETKSNLFLAPLAGVTDFAFRAIARDMGAGLSYTEMISAKGLILSKNREVYRTMLKTLSSEKPCCVQLFGSDPSFMAKACALPEIQAFDIIDINMGCPAQKVVKNGDGSALLLDLDKAEVIARACVESSHKPVTVKMRVGFFENDCVAVELAKRLEKAGVSAITVHGRTTKQMYSGKVNLEVIKAVKNAVSIPVIGNGDVSDAESLKAMLETGVDGVMIGRASMGAPWIFQELLTGKPLSNAEKFNLIKTHVKLLQTEFPDKYLTTYLRKHFLWYAKGFVSSSETKLRLAKTTSLPEALEILESLYLKKN